MFKATVLKNIIISKATVLKHKNIFWIVSSFLKIEIILMIKDLFPFSFSSFGYYAT